MRLAAAFAGLAALLAAARAHPPHVLSNIAVEAVREGPLDDAISITTSSSVVNDGDYVTVTYSGVTKPSDSDWIGVYSPSDANVSATAPIKYQMASHKQGAAYAAGGGGSLRFRLVNMRADYAFYFMRGGLDHPHVAAKSAPVSFVNPGEPLRPRLMVTGVPTQMRLMWSSPPTNNPYAKFGTSSGVYNTTIMAEPTTYMRDDMCGPPATTVGFRDPGQINDALLTPVQPGQTYFYVFGDHTHVSREYSFTVPPAPGDTSAMSLIAFGDMGQAAQDDSHQHYEEWPSLNTTRLIALDLQTMPVAALMHIGDVSYARGYSAEWDMFNDQIAPIASRLPYQISLGNHERDYPNSGSYYAGSDSGGECGVATEAQFHTPRRSFNQSWYSIELGMVKWVNMNTELNFTTGSEQYEWIQAELAGIDRSKTPWVIFGGHRPMYIDSDNVSPPAGDQPVATLLRKHIEPLLMKAKVDLGLWGHHHSGQRTCAVFAETCKAKASSTGVYSGPYAAPIHAVIGNAGQGMSTNILKEPPAWIEYVNIKAYGYARIHAVNATYLSMEAVSDIDHSVLDTMVIDRSG